MGRASVRFSCLILSNVARDVGRHRPEDQVLFSLFNQNGAGDDQTDAWGLGLRWLVPLWTHRDVEIRAAGLDVVGHFTSTSKGCRLIASNLKHIPGKKSPPVMEGLL
jgi:hypothetical protein